MSLKGKTYTTYQIAQLCDVYPTTVISWIKRKKIKAFATPGGHRRVLRPDLVSFLRKFDFPVPAQLRGERKRILIVEDEKVVGQVLARMLRHELGDVDVRLSENGVEALLAMGKTPPDLLVLDVVMPIVDGAAVLATLRRDPRTRDVKVIGITGKRLSVEKLKFMRRHSDAFFLKPFDMLEFADRARALLGAHRRV